MANEAKTERKKGDIDDLGNNSSEALRGFIERIETLEEEKKGIADDIKNVYAEAKGTGFDTKTMREIIRLRKMEASARQEKFALLQTYATALGLADLI